MFLLYDSGTTALRWVSPRYLLFEPRRVMEGRCKACDEIYQTLVVLLLGRTRNTSLYGIPFGGHGVPSLLWGGSVFGFLAPNLELFLLSSSCSSTALCRCVSLPATPHCDYGFDTSAAGRGVPCNDSCNAYNTKAPGSLRLQLHVRVTRTTTGRTW